MVTTVQSTDLDFNAIRNKLKDFFAASDQFADYDFEGAGLSNILDVLAYNTHFNSLVANLAINESFLETAQLRSSLITHAHSLGYFPRSRTSAKGYIKLSTNLSSFVGSRPVALTIATGKTFTSNIDGTTYTFRTRETLSAEDDGNGIYRFTTAEGSQNFYIYEGTEKTKTFFVPDTADDQIYVIPDLGLDTSTVDVRVYPNTSTTSYETYTNIKDAVAINNDSRYFLLKESPNGYYELQFGVGDNFGNKPQPGYKVTVTYLSSSGADANNGKVFTPSSGITVSGQTFPLTATTTTRSAGGAEKETLAEIRNNAPLTYATQHRMVTATDYDTLIRSNYPVVQDVTSWGGQDNIPVDYGVVYISLKFPSGTDASTITTTKNDIASNLVTPLAVLSIRPKFVDPETTYLKLNTTFDFNPTLSGVTLQTMQQNVTSTINSYFGSNLDAFKKEFRRSNLLTIIDDISPAVLSSKIDVRMVQRFTPKLYTNRNYTINFPTTIAGTDDVNRIITSSRFIYNNQVCIIQNALSGYNLQVTTAGGEVLLNNIGTYYPGTGVVELTSFNPESIIGGISYIKIQATPANPATIKPLRNYILSLDEESTVKGNIDYQTVRVSL